MLQKVVPTQDATNPVSPLWKSLLKKNPSFAIIENFIQLVFLQKELDFHSWRTEQVCKWTKYSVFY